MAEDSNPLEQERPKDSELGHQETVPVEATLGVYTDSTFNGLLELINAQEDITIEQLINMRRKDGHARALMQLLLLPMRYALQNGRWEAPDIVDVDSDKEVEFANLMWTLPKSAGGMSQPANKIIRQMLLSITDGFAPFEQVYDTAKKGPLKGKIILKKLSYCDPRTVRIMIDELGSYEGFRQRTHTADGKVRDVRVPKENTLVFTYQDELNPYYGLSIFESAYPHYEIRRKLYYIAHLAATFAAVPGRIGTVPPQATKQQIAEFKAALANFAFNTSMVKKQGFEVAPFNANTSFNFLSLIDHHRTMMTKSILAGFFDSENRTILIENADKDASADMFLLTLETLADDLAAVMTDYMMPKFIDWNFGTGIYPKFVPARLTDSSKRAVLELFQAFAMSPTLNCTPEMVREMEKKITKDFDLDIDYDSITQREKEAAELQAQQEAEQQQLLMQQQQNGDVTQDQVLNEQPQPPAEQPAAMSEAERMSELDNLMLAAQKLMMREFTSPVEVDEGL